jgi:hypothetical protein
MNCRVALNPSGIAGCPERNICTRKVEVTGHHEAVAPIISGAAADRNGLPSERTISFADNFEYRPARIFHQYCTGYPGLLDRETIQRPHHLGSDDFHDQMIADNRSKCKQRTTAAATTLTMRHCTRRFPPGRLTNVNCPDKLGTLLLEFSSSQGGGRYENRFLDVREYR